MNNDIDVSVYVITYCCERYIRQALDSVLNQETNYRFEIVVSDDFSSDNTASIIREYERLYPDTVRVFINERNLGIPKNIYNARSKCVGRYLCTMPGDDYWIDKYKIEKMARFLDENNEYFAICTAMELRYDFETIGFKQLPRKEERNIEYTMKDYERGKVLYSHGFMMRNLFLTENGRNYFKQAQEISDKIDDAVDNYLILRKGKVFIMDEITDVYRVFRKKEHSESFNARYTRFEKTQYSIELLNRMHEKFGQEIYLKNRYVKAFFVSILDALLGADVRKYKELYRSIPLEYRQPVYKGVFIKCLPQAVGFALQTTLTKLISVFKLFLW